MDSDMRVSEGNREVHREAKAVRTSSQETNVRKLNKPWRMWKPITTKDQKLSRLGALLVKVHYVRLCTVTH